MANLTNVGLPDGITTLVNDTGVVLLADASKGIVWRVDMETGQYSIAIQSQSFLPTNPEIPLGVDGIHVFKNYLYYTLFSSNALGRVDITANGSASGPLEIVAHMTFPDDFAIAADGTAYVAGDNTLYRVSPEGKMDILAGGSNDTILEGATSAQFGRTQMDSNVLYIGTNGGILAPVNGIIHGGQLAAINVGLFQ